VLRARHYVPVGSRKAVRLTPAWPHRPSNWNGRGRHDLNSAFGGSGGYPPYQGACDAEHDDDIGPQPRGAEQAPRRAGASCSSRRAVMQGIGTQGSGRSVAGDRWLARRTERYARRPTIEEGRSGWGLTVAGLAAAISLVRGEKEAEGGAGQRDNRGEEQSEFLELVHGEVGPVAE